jgi:hypothetical protein
LVRSYENSVVCRPAVLCSGCRDYCLDGDTEHPQIE